ncbi:hypothetical protein I6E84_11540 [Psychrobacter sp. SCQQ22]|uniref:hypothetical protein n=1 Tax=Psychrobacter sp. SCQQ22 TaxID=2792059 RepID=UPI0018CCB5CB|nr:hypothetical protein [Psychrobacter sp. SCQQ22]MBH0086848.1 hypothetical protein [Psychrobacter sp. SCQQ22]
MEDTMSSYSFSHQFYQRWTCAPEPIRAAITQELKDITTLLQSDTPFESFEFQTHDLDAHIDELYENHEAEQAIAKAIADKQEQARAAAEQQRVEEVQKIKAAEDAKLEEEAKLKEEAKLREEAEAAQKEQEKNATLAADKRNDDKPVVAVETNTENNANSSITDNSEKNNTQSMATENPTPNHKTISEHANTTEDHTVNNDSSTKNDSAIKAINDKASTAIKLALKDAKLSTTHQELIRELEVQIDDYLSEQMMLMSENLKSWLRAEVIQNLSDQDKSQTNKES